MLQLTIYKKGSDKYGYVSKKKNETRKNMKKNEGQDVDNKTNINWYIPTYGKLLIILCK